MMMYFFINIRKYLDTEHKNVLFVEHKHYTLDKFL